MAHQAWAGRKDLLHDRGQGRPTAQVGRCRPGCCREEVEPKSFPNRLRHIWPPSLAVDARTLAMTGGSPNHATDSRGVREGAGLVRDAMIAARRVLTSPDYKITKLPHASVREIWLRTWHASPTGMCSLSDSWDRDWKNVFGLAVLSKVCARFPSQSPPQSQRSVAFLARTGVGNRTVPGSMPVRLGVQSMEPARTWLREHHRAVEETNRIVEAIEPFFDSFDLRATLDYPGDIECDTHDRRSLISLTSRDARGCVQPQHAQHDRNHGFQRARV